MMLKVDIMILITVMGKLKYDFLRVTAVVAPVTRL